MRFVFRFNILQEQFTFFEDQFNTRVKIPVTRGFKNNDDIRVGPIDRPASVDYFFIGVTAVLEKDFRGNNGTLYFSSGSSKNYVDFFLIADTIPEKAEYLSLFLKNEFGDVVLGFPFEINITIARNDNPNGLLTILDSNIMFINEDHLENNHLISLIRYGGLFGKISVNWTIFSDSGLQAVDDFEIVEGIVFLEEGESIFNLSLKVREDNVAEESESFKLCFLKNSIVGGARFKDNSCREIILEDSDDVYGVFRLSSANSKIIYVRYN